MFENPLDLCVDVDNLLNTLLRYNGFYMLTVTDNAALPVEAPLKTPLATYFTVIAYRHHCHYLAKKTWVLGLSAESRQINHLVSNFSLFPLTC